MQNSAGTSNSNEGKIVSVKCLVWENDYPAELLEISTTGDFRKLRLISDSVPRKVTEFQFNSHWLTRRPRRWFRDAPTNTTGRKGELPAIKATRNRKGLCCRLSGPLRIRKAHAAIYQRRLGQIGLCFRLTEAPEIKKKKKKRLKLRTKGGIVDQIG